MAWICSCRGLDVPTAVRDDLLRFLPADDVPVRLKKAEKTVAPIELVAPLAPEPTPAIDLRRAVWDFIALAPNQSQLADIRWPEAHLVSIALYAGAQ